MLQAHADRHRQSRRKPGSITKQQNLDFDLLHHIRHYLLFLLH